MQPVNNKSLLHFLFDQMEKLDSGAIKIDQAKAQAALAKQANQALKYEMDRVHTLITLDQYKRSTGASIEFRNVEGKNFD
jgi:hypothetical protein